MWIRIKEIDADKAFRYKLSDTSYLRIEPDLTFEIWKNTSSRFFNDTREIPENVKELAERYVISKEVLKEDFYVVFDKNGFDETVQVLKDLGYGWDPCSARKNQGIIRKLDGHLLTPVRISNKLVPTVTLNFLKKMGFEVDIYRL